MTERLRLLPLLAAVAVLLVSMSAALASEQAQAQKCSPVCLPPPEEGEEEPPPPPPRPLPPPPKTILVIGVGWNTGSARTSSPLEPGRNGLYLDYLRGHFNEWLKKSAAPVTLPSWQPTSGGEYTIAAPRIPDFPDFGEPEHGCTGPETSAFFGDIAGRAEEKARQSGINPDSYTVVVVHWVRRMCIGGTQSGRRIGLTRPEVAIHEFGHYYGLAHANSLRCRDASGVLVALSGDCVEREYDDSYDAMGNVSPDASYNAIHTNQLGWLNGQFVDLAAGDFARTFTLRPLTDPLHTERALRLRDGSATLWLEYRTEVGIDDDDFSGHRFFPEPGLLIHREAPTAGAPGSQLLDMTPGSVLDPITGAPGGNGDFDDAALGVGRTWANPLGEMKITVNGETASGATVTISSQRLTVPDVRGLTPSRAADALQAAGLRAGGIGGFPDVSCADIGLVMFQSPNPGARVLPGTAVSLTLGEQPSGECA